MPTLCFSQFREAQLIHILKLLSVDGRMSGQQSGIDKEYVIQSSLYHCIIAEHLISFKILAFDDCFYTSGNFKIYLLNDKSNMSNNELNSNAGLVIQGPLTPGTNLLTPRG